MPSATGDELGTASEITGDMRPIDIVHVLEDLQFVRRGRLRPLLIDRDVRDYLINTLRGRHAVR